MSVNRSTKMLRNMVVLPEMEENGVRIENKDEVIGWLMQERTWGGITRNEQIRVERMKMKVKRNEVGW
ncbi:hypothetical protein N7490_000734 [Penicillium lividum]|nr:hypothetical protein N7490_000734 [Penicillium lividum]